MTHETHPLHPVKLTFSSIEKRDLLKAWLLSSLAFAIAFAGLGRGLIIALPLSLVTAGAGILLHELAHKAVAQRFGYHAEFRSFDTMLMISCVLAVLGFVFIAPGAVFFTGPHDARKSGIIALAGPLTNIFLALLFLPLVVLDLPQLIGAIALYAFTINAWLGLFNLVPFMGLDGEKVLAWNPKVFWPSIVFAGALVFARFYFF